MNIHTVFESNNHKYVFSGKKSDNNNHNRYGMGYNGLQDVVYVDAMLPASTLHQYSNME